MVLQAGPEYADAFGVGVGGAPAGRIERRTRLAIARSSGLA